MAWDDDATVNNANITGAEWNSMRDYIKSVISSSGEITSSNINNIVFVDGVTYAATGAGIQAAIDSLPATGGEVYIPAGTYTLSDKILLSSLSNIMIRGAGNSTIITMANNVNKSIIEVTSCDNIMIRDIYIDGNGPNNTGSVNYGVDVSGGTDFNMENCYIYNTDNQSCRLYNSLVGANISNCTFDTPGDDAFTCANATDVEIKSCTASNTPGAANSGFGFYATDANCKRNIISDCISYSNAGNGYHFEGANNILVSSCISRDNAKSGFAVLEEAGGQDGESIQLDNCHSYNNTENGFTINGTTARKVILNACKGYDNTLMGININGDLTGNSNIIISACILDNNDDYGIQVQAGKFVTIDACHCINHQTDNYGLGIYVKADASFVTVKGCTLAENNGAGITIAGADNVTVVDNTIVNNGQFDGSQDGINISNNSTSLIIRGNKITDTQGVPTQTYGIDVGTGCTNCIVTGNNLVDNKTGAINGTFGAGSDVSHNITT